MIAGIHSSRFPSALEQLQCRFLGILPRIERHARIYFRHVGCRQKRTDLIAETVALAWKWFARLAEKGRDGTQFPTALASYAAKAVRSGRRVCGQERGRDVMSQCAQQRHSFCVGKCYTRTPERDSKLKSISEHRQTLPEHSTLEIRAFPSRGRAKNARIIPNELEEFYIRGAERGADEFSVPTS
jgi:hypothetical protein